VKATRRCGGCRRSHGDLNPKTGSLFARCSVCRRKRRDYSRSLKLAGKCRDCRKDSGGNARCLDCARAIRQRLRRRGRCLNCGGKAEPGRSQCARCVVTQTARKKLGDPSRATELLGLFLNQRGRCAISGVQISIGLNASVDRIIPINRGGTNDSSNLRWVHVVVNRMKNDMLDVELSSWCALISKSKTIDHTAVAPRLRSWPSGADTATPPIT